MRFGELKLQLRAKGCYIVVHGSNHDTWYSPKTGAMFPVGRHDREEVPIGTLRSIQKQAGLR